MSWETLVPSIVTAVGTLLVVVISRSVAAYHLSQRRQRTDHKSDMEFSADLRDDLYKQIRDLRKEIVTCEDRAAAMANETRRLSTQNESQAMQIAWLTREVEYLRTELRDLRARDADAGDKL